MIIEFKYTIYKRNTIFNLIKIHNHVCVLDIFGLNIDDILLKLNHTEKAINCSNNAQVIDYRIL